MSAWKCSCGRMVPADLERCRCGKARQRTGAPRPASGKGARNALLIGGAALSAVAVAFGAFILSRGRTPATKGVDATPPPVAVSQPVAVAAAAQPAPSPIEQPDASTAERWAALGAAAETPQAPATTMVGAFPMPPPLQSSEPPPAPTPEGPSETQALQEKIERYRAEYGPAKQKVESLERQVAELTDLATKVYADGNSASATTNAGVVRARLDRARGDLEAAREALTAIEERARRDGVGYGQLY